MTNAEARVITAIVIRMRKHVLLHAPLNVDDYTDLNRHRGQQLVSGINLAVMWDTVKMMEGWRNLD